MLTTTNRLTFRTRTTGTRLFGAQSCRAPRRAFDNWVVATPAHEAAQNTTRRPAR